MLHLLIEISKYIIILLFLIYTFEAFWVLRYDNNGKSAKRIYNSQNRLMFLIHADAFLVLYLTTQKIEVLGFYLMQVVLFAAILILYKIFYKNASRLLINNMCMLMCVGMIILTRLSYEKALKQYFFMVAGLAIIMFFPLILSSTSSLFRRLGWLYAVVGILALASVTVLGKEELGAKLSISFGGYSVQPSEFVKIIFVFFIASMLYQRHNFKQVAITAAGAGLFLLVLVASKDLGSALLYYVAFLAMVYVASKKPAYLILGLGAVVIASIAGYMLFSHVRVRVAAWQDPFSDPAVAGYQILRSLFGIGTGGWFGLGLSQGAPELIPLVEKDVIFSAISEEMGGIFALCLIAVYISCFLIIFNISMKLKDQFYRLAALGLGCIYAMQVFLTIGGMIKFVPSTGVTLPLISYGGSSLLSTVILFGIIQAMYLMQAKGRKQEELSDSKKKKAPEPEAEKQIDEEIIPADDPVDKHAAAMPVDTYEQEEELAADVSRIFEESRDPDETLAANVSMILRENEAQKVRQRVSEEAQMDAASYPVRSRRKTEPQKPDPSAWTTEDELADSVAEILAKQNRRGGDR